MSTATVETPMLAPKWQPRWAPWVFLAPFLLIFAVFTAYPLVRSLVLSTEQTWGPGESRFVGLANYKWLLSDRLFYTALSNTALYTLGSLVVQLPLALGLALVLETQALLREDLRILVMSATLDGVAVAQLLAGDNAR